MDSIHNTPQMLSIRQVAATGILPENAIRAGVKAGWVPHIMCGKKALINFTRLVAILNGEEARS